MRDNLFITFFVIVFSCTHWLCVETQDFCESYKQNNYSLIVFSPNADSILLIVDKHFWKLREKDTELMFNRSDFQASNSSEQWTESNYTFANLVLDKNDSNYRGIALFKNINKTNITDHFRIDYYDFHRNYFKDNGGYLNEHLRSLQETKFTFTIFEESMDCVVIQTFNETSNKFERKVDRRKYWRTFNKGHGYAYSQDTDPICTSNKTQDIETIRNFKNDIPMIGSYFNSKNKIISFFRINDDINYCTIDECIKKKYKVLISCSQKVWTQFVSNIWIPIAITVVVIVVFVIMVANVIYCMRKSKEQTAPKNELARASSINTINSKTGLPLHPSKIKRTGRSRGKSVSPKKVLQNLTKPGEPKVEPKQKNSPKLKK